MNSGRNKSAEASFSAESGTGFSRRDHVIISYIQIVMLDYSPCQSLSQRHCDYRDLRIIFDNPTDNDYQDIDITVGPDFPNIIIAAIGQISNILNVTFHNPVMQAYLRPDGTPECKFDKKIGHSVGDKFIFRVENQSKGQGLTPLRVYPNRYRIRCEKLPRHMILEITLAIPIQDIAKQKGKINTVWIKGQYNGGTKMQNIDQNITVTSQSFIPLLSPS